MNFFIIRGAASWLHARQGRSGVGNNLDVQSRCVWNSFESISARDWIVSPLQVAMKGVPYRKGARPLFFLDRFDAVKPGHLICLKRFAAFAGKVATRVALAGVKLNTYR